MSGVLRSAHCSPRHASAAIRRCRSRALAGAAALLALGLPTFVAAASAGAATSAAASTTSTSRISELLRKELEKNKSAKAPAVGATAQPSTGTTTYVPSSTATAPPAASAPATGTTTPAATAPTTPAATTPTAATAAPAPATTAAGAAAPASSTKASKGDRPLSTGAIVIAALAALLVLACLGWALARRRAFEPHWLLSLRHATAEAGFRASATWSEFLDWVRLGH
jgi:cobalamin biosynthesis Mg chelatase CobN